MVGHSDERDRAVTVLDHEGGRSVLTSNWRAADTSKQTTLEYAGDRQVRMDHTSLTATVIVDGLVTEHVGYAGAAGRKEAHYRGLYDVLCSTPRMPGSAYRWPARSRDSSSRPPRLRRPVSGGRRWRRPDLGADQRRGGVALTSGRRPVRRGVAHGELVAHAVRQGWPAEASPAA